MWKLIYSDYEKDKPKLTKVQGKTLTNIHNVLNQYSIVNKTRFTVVGLYADNKKYTVVARTTNPLYNYIFAIKPYSTHKDNTKFWLTVVDLTTNRMTEFVANSKDLMADIKKYCTFIDSISKNNAYPLDNIKDYIHADIVNDNFNNSTLYNASIVEIDRVWVEQLRGESIL